MVGNCIFHRADAGGSAIIIRGIEIGLFLQIKTVTSLQNNNRFDFKVCKWKMLVIFLRESEVI